MAKTIINLDEMYPDPPETIIVHKGEEHTLLVTTTEVYLKVLRARNRLNRIDQTDEAAMTEESIKLLSLVLPTIPANEFQKMRLPRLMKLVDVVQEQMKELDAPKPEPTFLLDGEDVNRQELEVVSGE